MAEETMLAGRASAPRQEARRGEFTVSCDPARMEFAVIYQFLSNSYWSLGIPEATVRRAMDGSLCFGIFGSSGQVGFARVITDRATFAYLADVFVLEPFRGRGLSKWLMEVILAHPDLQDLRRWMLATRDAHGLYRQSGFAPLRAPERFMEKHDPDVYARAGASGKSTTGQ